MRFAAPRPGIGSASFGASFSLSFGSFATAKGSRGLRIAAAPAASVQARTSRRVEARRGALLMAFLGSFGVRRSGSVVRHELGRVAEGPHEVLVALGLGAALVHVLQRGVQLARRRVTGEDGHVDAADALAVAAL